VKESTVRPMDPVNKYVKLSVEDATTYFSSTQRENIPCPACGRDSVLPVFEKRGFDY